MNLDIMLSETDISTILENFPKFELSYETMIHKKVLGAPILLAIPEGPKCFAWFTSYKEDNVCFILEIGENKNITNVSIIKSSFADSLSLGTIFYGTYFKINSTSPITSFTIEDIYYYKGKMFTQNTYLDKLQTLKHIFKNEISQNCITKDMVIFGLPLLGTNFNILLRDIESVPYKVSQIKFRFFDKANAKKIVYVKYFKPGSQRVSNNMNNNSNIKMPLNAIFKVTPDIQSDIYNLFYYKDGKEEYYDVAFIADFKTSVMMNKLFRNIKENRNLDYLEESDDDEEFEDTRADKFVYLDKSFKMICEYNQKFKRWAPIQLANKNDRIISSNLLQNR
jgi:hypothetical protein